MTREEFSKTKFRTEMRAVYQNHEYDVISVNFEEDLFGLGDDTSTDTSDLMWVRCESVELV